MMEMRLGPAALARTRFGYSPLSEVAASVHMFSAGVLHPLHRPWMRGARAALRRVDAELLTAVVPARPEVAQFLFAGVRDRSTTLDEQLEALIALGPDGLRHDLELVWRPGPLPPVLDRALRPGAAGAAGVRRIADALRGYWEAVISPHWPRLRSVLDADVGHRAQRLVEGGAAALFADLHPEVSLAGGTVRIDKPYAPLVRELPGEGLLLVPSVFTWPHLITFGDRAPDQPALVYAVRGIGEAWSDRAERDTDPLAALLGRSRATALRLLAAPRSPTRLAALLGQSPSSACQHLSVLRRSGLASSVRNGREVLYERTELGTQLMAACEPPSAVAAPRRVPAAATATATRPEPARQDGARCGSRAL